MNNKFKDMYITIPFGKMYHIFGKDDRSLCGKAMMWKKDPNQCEPVTGKEKYHKGEDCKACFRKAGLLEETKHGQ